MGKEAIIEMPTVNTDHLKMIMIEWSNTDGKKRRWEAVKRLKKDNKKIEVGAFDKIVVVIPITDKEEIVFISQFRATVGAVLAGNEELIDESRYQIIEFPAGVVDEAGKTGVETAISELAEEAGYGAREFLVINEGAISAGLSFEYVTEYLARDLFEVPRAKGDEESVITVHKVPLIMASEWIHEREEDGFVIDSRVRPLISLVKELLRGE